MTIQAERMQNEEATMDDSILDNCSKAVKQIDIISLHIRIELSVLANRFKNRHKWYFRAQPWVSIPNTVD